MTTLAGEAFVLAEQPPGVTILLFGELYNRNTLAACRDIGDLLASARGQEVAARAYLVISQAAAPGELQVTADKNGIGLPILRDERSRAMGTYGVRVLPTLVVLGPDGRVTLASSGYPIYFVDLLTDALYLAAGEITAAQYQRRRQATSLQQEPENRRRARRLAALGEQLLRRGNDALARGSYEDALSADPDCVEAHLGLARVHLGHGELVPAEQRFNAALQRQPDNLDAALGLVQIGILRGGDLEQAQQRLQGLLRDHPLDPRGHYLAGLLAERSDDAQSALQHYRRAAELSLFGQVQQWKTQ